MLTYSANENDRWVLQELVARLSRLGYSEYCASFNPLALRWERWVAYRNKAPNKLYRFIDLFLLNQAVPPEMVEGRLGDLIEPLHRLGLLSYTRSGWLKMPNLILIPVFGNWFFLQTPQLNPKIYYGDDSIALLLRLRPKRGGRHLDLCAGAGVQALQCSLFASHVTAVEIDPEAVRLAQLNVLMNGREETISVYCGDLYEPVRGETFDTIVANPPLVPFPDHLPYPPVGHGGTDGLRVTRRILQGLPAALASDGTAQLIGACLSDGKRPLIEDELRRWAREAEMDVLMTVTAHHPLAPGTPWFKRIVWTAAVGMKASFQTIKTDYQRALAEQGASHLCAYFLHITRGEGRLDLQDLSTCDAPGLWYI